MPKTHAHSHPSDPLATAFAAAEYLVEAGDETLRVRIGRRHPRLDARTGGRAWALVTAFNPGARRQPEAANHAADAALARRLRRRRPDVLLRCRNRDPAGRWPDEPGWLFAPATAAEADRVGREFGQAAVVYARAGEPASLRFADRRDPAGAGREPGKPSA
jgi:hypothetical protein